MLRAIVTTYVGPTDTRGSRIRASTYGYKCFVPYKPELNADANHLEAARAVWMRLGKRESDVPPFVAAAMPDGHSIVFVPKI